MGEKLDLGVRVKPGEKCAVAAVIGVDIDAAKLVVKSLFALQHRGPEASGVASQLKDGGVGVHRAPGYVCDVFDGEEIASLAGEVAVGHNKYSTNGSKHRHLQPVFDDTIGFAFSHNGNLPILDMLESSLIRNDVRIADLNDSEMAGYAIAQEILSGSNLADGVERVYPLLQGAFSCVAMHDGLVVAFRDPKGIRPLALGKLEDGHAVSSETCGLDIIGADYMNEVPPGSMIVLSKDGIEETRQLSEGDSKLDMFEFVYFARHDSQLYGQSVNEIRRCFGEQLAEMHPPTTDDVSNTLVVPIPDTSVPAAEGYAETLGLVHRQAVIKNRYVVARTFLQPSHVERQDQLRLKHNIIPQAIKGRDIIFIDDSIIRLNTMPRLVQQAQMAGARSVMVLIASPPVRFPDFYGIDTPKQSELAAANMTTEQMREQIGCDYLGFLSLSRMVKATGIAADMFNLSAFNGEYPIDIGPHKHDVRAPISTDYLD